MATDAGRSPSCCRSPAGLRLQAAGRRLHRRRQDAVRQVGVDRQTEVWAERFGANAAWWAIGTAVSGQQKKARTHELLVTSGSGDGPAPAPGCSQSPGGEGTPEGGGDPRPFRAACGWTGDLNAPRPMDSRRVLGVDGRTFSMPRQEVDSRLGGTLSLPLSEQYNSANSSSSNSCPRIEASRP